MKILSSICFLILGAILLSACEPMLFGMPESQFKTLTPPQQEQVINAYNQQKAIEKQNEPLNNLIGVAGTAVREQNTRR